jgi:EmrB/QacA subfamily drug resistance transporter
MQNLLKKNHRTSHGEKMIQQSDSPNRTASPAVTLFVVSAVQFLTPFMFSAVGVALPTIGREFGSSAVQLSLIEMVYILAVALLLLPSGRFADIHGRRRIFITGTVVLTMATILLAVAPNIEVLIFLRFLQGTGAALITSTSIAILSSVFEPKKRGRAMGIIVACVYMGLSAGPTLAGVMITHMGWRWIFIAAVPIEIATLVLTLTRLKGEWAEARGEPFDWPGSLIYMIALFWLIFGTTRLNETVFGKWFMLAGFMGLVVFIIFEWRIASPVLDVRLLASNRTFAFSNIATWINYAASFGVTFFFSLYLQFVKGFSPQTAGFILVIQPIVMAVIAPISGRLSDIYPPARIATLGMGLCAGGLGMSAMLGADSSLAMVITVLVLLGTGFGFFSTPNMTVIMGSVTARHYGVASSMVATMRSIGMLTSMAIITVAFTIFMGHQPVSGNNQREFIASMQMVLMIFSVMSLVGILFSLGRLNRAPEKR